MGTELQRIVGFCILLPQPVEFGHRVSQKVSPMSWPINIQLEPAGSCSVNTSRGSEDPDVCSCTQSIGGETENITLLCSDESTFSHDLCYFKGAGVAGYSQEYFLSSPSLHKK